MNTLYNSISLLPVKKDVRTRAPTICDVVALPSDIDLAYVGVIEAVPSLIDEALTITTLDDKLYAV